MANEVAVEAQEEPEPMTREQYLALDADGRAMARCFVSFDLLPVEALDDMRSLSIKGQSLARQLVDDHRRAGDGAALIPASVLNQAQQVVALYEDRTVAKTGTEAS